MKRWTKGPQIRAAGTIRGNGAAREIAGRTIRGVVARQAKNGASPAYQLFIAFTDGTYLELYSDSPIQTASLDIGGIAEIKKYMSDEYDVVLEAETLPAVPAPDARVIRLAAH